MKKILLFLFTASILSGCYDDFRLDHEHSTVAFSYVTGGSNQPGVLWRTVVKDEGLKLDVGVYLAGILENEQERWADFVIDPSLLDETDYIMLPSNYYTLSNDSRFIIPKGLYVGRITVNLDSTLFLNDSLATAPNYALPIRLTGTSEDSILSTQHTQVVVIKYINHYEGFYIHKGSAERVSATGETISTTEIDNVISTSTVFIDKMETNGFMEMIGDDYHMNMLVNADNSVSLSYKPDLSVEIVSKNLALDATASTSHVSDWEKLEGINDDYQPTSSTDKGEAAYGNWPNAMTWNWVEYEFASAFDINQSNIYWWTDHEGIQIPFNTYLEYWDMDTEEWKVVEEPVVNGTPIAAENYVITDTLIVNEENPSAGVDSNQYNTTTFKNVITNKVRVHFIATESQGILEWQVWGVALATEAIESITENGVNRFDPATNTFTLNYKVNYKYDSFVTNVTSTMKWRNRIRDSVNEWRR